ncbi:MAG: hypothetical protein CVV52_01075 [Spirochaetae bacterium HGW-Spirochaetae-8]|jgi:DNA-binding MarR family transcriptional regulator|nr:MAG: hypothetical protein CVV52_01075 [Spirochaetae bacterium HGW-Spirochaetae-8]
MFMKHIAAMTRYWQAYTHRSLMGIDLVCSEHAVIMYLAQQDNVNQDAISGNLSLDKGTIARTLAKLEEKNLVVREVNDLNRREKLVSLTPYGRAEVDIVMKVSDNWKTAVMQGLNSTEQDLFFNLLERITRNARELAHPMAEREIHEN